MTRKVVFMRVDFWHTWMGSSHFCTFCCKKCTRDVLWNAEMLFFVWVLTLSTRIEALRLIGGNMAVVQGGTVVLPCKLTDTTDNLNQITWQRRTRGKPKNENFFTIQLNGRPKIVSEDDKRFKFGGSMDDNIGSLQLSNVTLKDEGIYTCIFTLFPSGNHKTEIPLNVLVPPVSSLEDNRPTLGNEEISLVTCTAAGSRPPAVVRWDVGALKGKVRENISSVGHDNGTTTTTSSLTGEPTKDISHHEVQCVISSPALERKETLSFTVQVYCIPPLWLKSSSDEEKPTSRKKRRLLVTSEGNPPTHAPASDTAGASGSAVTVPAQLACELYETAKDGTVWRSMQPGLRTGRAQSQNIVTEKGGPTPYARRNIIDPMSAFMCLVDRVMLQHICDCTVAEARRCGQVSWELSLAELKAFIALLLARGVHNGMHIDVEDLWSKEWGLPFFSTTMSRNRYREIMRYLRFDQKDTRRTRLSQDKFALVSEVWDRLIQNSLASHKPGAEITVDEQLFPTKSRCTFTQYMPNKPDKFGIKFWLAADVDTKYLCNGYPYLGRDPSRPATVSLWESVVLKLMEPFLEKGRNVMTDNFFTSLPLAHKLLAKNTSLVGTTNKNKRSLPPSAHLQAALHDTKVMRSDSATVTIYQGKEKKVDQWRSTMTPRRGQKQSIIITGQK